MAAAQAVGTKALVIKSVPSQGATTHVVQVPVAASVGTVKLALEAAAGTKASTVTFIYSTYHEHGIVAKEELLSC